MVSREKRYYPEYDVVRVIATLLVIISHCTYYELGAPNEGTGYLALIDPGFSLFYRVAIQINNIIFHMPLYMALSGALFKNTKNGYSSCHELIINKSKRLLVPFISVLFFYAVPVKVLAGFYSQANTLGDVIQFVLVNELFVQKSFYLWFLPVLFLIFVLTYLMEKYSKAPCILKLLILLVISYGYGAIPLNVLSLTAKMMVWFYAGYCFEEYREWVNSRIKGKYWLVIPLFLLFFALFIVIELIPNPKGVDLWTAIRKPLESLCTVAGCLSVYFVSYYLSGTTLLQNKAFRLIRENTFGLYLYSDPWNYVVLAAMITWLGKAVFVTNWGSAAVYFARMFVTGGMALTVSVLLKKMNREKRLKGD